MYPSAYLSWNKLALSCPIILLVLRINKLSSLSQLFRFILVYPYNLSCHFSFLIPFHIFCVFASRTFSAKPQETVLIIRFKMDMDCASIMYNWHDMRYRLNLGNDNIS